MNENYDHYRRQLQAAQQSEAQGALAKAVTQYKDAARALLAYMAEAPATEKQSALKNAALLTRVAQELSAKIPAPRKSTSNTKKAAVPEESQPAERAPKAFYTVEKPSVRFEDIAGLEEVKRSIRLRVIAPYLNPGLYARFRKELNGGILLYGPPGTGKTMIARAIATETDVAFFSIRCSDIVGSFFGEAERNLRDLFEAARETQNAMIFFDEFDALATKRGGHSTVMNRLVPELLSQMDGFVKAQGRLIILAATNRPWDLDSAVLRPPRMTERIYVGLPDHDARAYILRKGLDDLPMDADADLDGIADRTDGYNCADIAALCERIKDGPIERGNDTGDEEQFITQQDIDDALRAVRSSVQESDLKSFDKWHAQTK